MSVQTHSAIGDYTYGVARECGRERLNCQQYFLGGADDL
jgi:hypothetical protein